MMKNKKLLSYLGVFTTLLITFNTKTHMRIQNKTKNIVYCSISNLNAPRRKFAEIRISPNNLPAITNMTKAQLQRFTYLRKGTISNPIKLQQGALWFEVDKNGNVKCWKLDYLPLYRNAVPSTVAGEHLHFFETIDHMIIKPNGECEFIINKDHARKEKDRYKTTTAQPVELKNVFFGN